MGSTALTIHLPNEDLEFAKRYAKEHHMTLTELFDHQLRRLRRRVEHHEGSEFVDTASEITEDLRADPNYVAYEREKKRLQSEHPGKYVAYCQGARVALGASQAEVFSFLETKFSDEDCLVQHLSQEPRRVSFHRPRNIRSLGPSQ